jgi:hypothetical protein
MKSLRNVFAAMVLGGFVMGLCSGAEKLQPPGTTEPARDLPVKEAVPEKAFDLNFSGGTPELLVDMIQKEAKMPLNVIIPQEHKDVFLPPLKLRGITVAQLFEAITAASVSMETRITGYSTVAGGRERPQFQHVTTRFGFKTPNQPPRANSIWYFYVDSPPPPPEETAAQPRQCRFWQLEPYLQNLKVEDITTAIETGWKMLGVNPLPKLSFHKDTKLLIVVGQPSQLTIVDEALRELTPRLDPATGIPMRKGSPERATQSGQGEKPSR